MGKANIFSGKGKRSHYAYEIYCMFLQRKKFSLADVQKLVLNSSEASYDIFCLSNSDGYGELKKAFGDVKSAIIEAVGDDNCIKSFGNNRTKQYLYDGLVDDPLEDMLNAKRVLKLQQYYKFCCDSAGLLPHEWLEFFFKDCQDLAVIKKRQNSGEQVISVSIDRQQKNIELFPWLYVAIDNKSVLQIDYKPYEEVVETLIFHPHFLKEYNGRWYLFGHAEGKEPEFGYNLALDRIQGHPIKICEKQFKKAPAKFYTDFFKNIVGVSHEKGATIEKVILRAHGTYMFNLTETKLIHESQKLYKKFGKYEDGEYGEFSLEIEPNNEFMGRILMMGAGLEIITPETIRQKFAHQVKLLAGLYGL